MHEVVSQSLLRRPGRQTAVFKSVQSSAVEAKPKASVPALIDCINRLHLVITQPVLRGAGGEFSISESVQPAIGAHPQGSSLILVNRPHIVISQSIPRCPGRESAILEPVQPAIGTHPQTPIPA